jgi:hypothetical protein
MAERGISRRKGKHKEQRAKRKGSGEKRTNQAISTLKEVTAMCHRETERHTQRERGRERESERRVVVALQPIGRDDHDAIAGLSRLRSHHYCRGGKRAGRFSCQGLVRANHVGVASRDGAREVHPVITLRERERERERRERERDEGQRGEDLPYLPTYLLTYVPSSGWSVSEMNHPPPALPSTLHSPLCN